MGASSLQTARVEASVRGNAEHSTYELTLGHHPDGCVQHRKLRVTGEGAFRSWLPRCGTRCNSTSGIIGGLKASGENGIVRAIALLLVRVELIQMTLEAQMEEQLEVQMTLEAQVEVHLEEQLEAVAPEFVNLWFAHAAQVARGRP
jgi:hypothetical protein